MTSTTGFDQSIAYLDALYHRPLLPASQVGLMRVEFLLDRLGNPQQAFRSVHIAGSSGKGSTTTMIASIVRAAGFRTGRFSSPHLESIRERMEVGDDWISPEDWAGHWESILPIVDAMTKNAYPGYDMGRPAYFEVLFALMALHFASRGVEWAAVETGMGGRLDATNTLHSDVAVITNISLEHTQILGKTIEKIAREKAAIVKAGSYAVTAADDLDALKIIRARAEEVEVPLLEIPRDVEALATSRDLFGQRLELRSPAGTQSLRLPLAGDFQARNAATAYAAGIALQSRGVNLSSNDLLVGLSSASVPGRFEVVSRDPRIILDGAHNPAAALALRCSLDAVLTDVPIVLLFGAMADKDVASMARELGPIATRVYVTTVPGAHRPSDGFVAAEAFRPYCQDVILTEDADVALERALQERSPAAAVVICGSMYLVGYVRHKLVAAVAS